MANLKETPFWETGIYQWETSDPVMGGENGIDNKPTRQLANRTQWLKTEIARAIELISTNQSVIRNTTISAGAGLTGGGNLSANRSIALATPSTLSGSTTNWAGNGTTGHTHQLAAATSQIAGVVKLINHLNSEASDSALTAAQGLVLMNALKSMGYDNLDKGTSSRAGIDLDTLTAHASATYVNYNSSNIAKTLPEWWQKYHLPSAETQWGVVLVWRESASIIYQLFLTPLGQVWFRFISLNNPSSQFNKYGWQRLDGADWGKIRNKPNNLVDTDTAQTITGEKTFSGSLKANGGVVVSYTNDWVGYIANQPTEAKHLFFDAHVKNIARGGLQIASDGNGRYVANICVTPTGATTSDRRVVGMMVSDTSINTRAYGWLHEGFVRANNGIGQSSGHQIKIGWSGSRLKAQVDDTDLGNIVFDNQLNETINRAIPSGTVVYFLGDYAPAGWLKANGAQLSRSVYASLFAAIGTRYGGGDGTFNLPDLRGEFVRVWDDGRGVDGGRVLGSWQTDEFRSHQHATNWGLFNEGGNAVHSIGSGDGYRRENIFNLPTEWSGGTETRPRNIALTAIIKI